MNLFINCCFRDGSRTLKLAQKFIEKENKTYEEIVLGKGATPVLDYDNLNVYGEAIGKNDFSGELFQDGRKFAEAEEIVIAAPYWNNSIPAVLHAFLEIVTSQGVTFYITPEGEYKSLCKAKKLTFITTAGGFIPEENYSFGYIKSLATDFWKIDEVKFIKAEGLDIAGNDVEEILEKVEL